MGVAGRARPMCRLLAAAQLLAAASATKNVLMLIVDDLRADLAAARAPRIKALGAQSVQFTDAHAQVANCAPSRSSLLTGLRPDATGVLDLETHFRSRRPHVVTMPQHFRQAGYLAVSYGKIFHQYLDDQHSWSSQAEFPDNHTYRGLSGEAWIRHGGYSKGWKYSQYQLKRNQKALHAQAERDMGHFYASTPPCERGPDANRRGHGYTDYTIASRAVRAIGMLRAQPKPCFLAVGFVRPHLPFNAPAPFWDGASAGALAQPSPTPSTMDLSPLTRSHLRSGDAELHAFANGSTHHMPAGLR